MASANKSLDEEIVVLLERRYINQEKAPLDYATLQQRFPQASEFAVARQVEICEALFGEIHEHLMVHRWEEFLPGQYDTDTFREYHAQLGKKYALVDRQALEWLLHRMHHWLVDR